MFLKQRSEELTVPSTTACLCSTLGERFRTPAPEKDFPKECSSQQDQPRVGFLDSWRLCLTQIMFDLV